MRCMPMLQAQQPVVTQCDSALAMAVPGSEVHCNTGWYQVQDQHCHKDIQALCWT